MMISFPSLFASTMSSIDKIPSLCVRGIGEVWKCVHDFVMGIIGRIKRCFMQESSLPLSGRSVHGPLNLFSFYRGIEPNNNGVSLDQILGWDDFQLESVHNYIQWLFPLEKPTAYNPTAPILDAITIRAFCEDTALKAQLLRSFRRMLTFYGLQMNEATKTISRAPTFNARACVWLINPAGHHNFLRISRILRSMHILGHPDYSASFLTIMRDITHREGNGIIPGATLSFWENAARPTS